MFSKNLRTITKSQTLLLNEQSRLLESEGKRVYKFGFGQSPFSPPAYAVKALQENSHQHYYSSVQGIPALREAIATFHSQQQGLNISPDKVFIGPGSKTLIYCLLCCFQKARVFIPAPAWVSYEPQAEMLGHDVIRIATQYQQAWRLTPDLLAQALAGHDDDLPAVLILNYPGNPDGLTYSADELEALANVMRQHRMLVISDEIYGFLHHDGNHQSLAQYYPEGTIITTGLSKWAGAGGWRLGAAILPETTKTGFTECLLGIASEVYSCAATPVQLAAIEAYSRVEDTLDYIRHQRRILARLGQTCHTLLSDAGIHIHAPVGGFYLFVDFMPLQTLMAKQAILTSEQLCEAILADTGVALLPSTAFGVPGNYLSARLAYVDFDGNAALAASENIGLKKALPADFVQTYCQPTLEGIERLAGWAAAYKTGANTVRTKELQ